MIETRPGRARAPTRARSATADRLPLLRQLSVRDQVSLFASHPPAGLRHQMLAARRGRTHGWC
ncbi:hypothetical protein JNW88_25080 [Micromonospora sp. ATA32]|nr:hypothetical protein [Micromonospora sp. ATA32]